jgi:U3 small nucleolar ribonucleoprotein protein IMP4
MTLVTTSRRSTIESRAVARDLAFALGARYLARGKQGIRDLAETDSSFFILSQEEKGLILQWYHHGSPVLERKILSVEKRRREGLINRRVMTSDTLLGKSLPQFFSLTGEGEKDLIITFDGPQRRQTLLRIGRRDPEER